MKPAINADEAVLSTIGKIKEITGSNGINRASLNLAKLELDSLARREDLWTEARYPAPTLPELTSFYLVHKDEETGISLYINVMLTGESTVIHNHTTWACIASIEGEETNHLFERTDDGSQPGKATVVRKGIWKVVPGNPIGILPDDIHSVANTGETAVRHLHLYGCDVKNLRSRLMFDIEAGTCTEMPIIVVDND